MNMPVFTKDQKVVAEVIGGYECHLTKGKEYTVLEYKVSERAATFTWPAYVVVMGDRGRRLTAHAHRFKPKEEEK